MIFHSYGKELIFGFRKKEWKLQIGCRIGFSCTQIGFRIGFSWTDWQIEFRIGFSCTQIEFRIGFSCTQIGFRIGFSKKSQNFPNIFKLLNLSKFSKNIFRFFKLCLLPVASLKLFNAAYDYLIGMSFLLHWKKRDQKSWTQNFKIQSNPALSLRLRAGLNWILKFFVQDFSIPYFQCNSRRPQTGLFNR